MKQQNQDNEVLIKIFDDLPPDLKRETWKMKDECFSWRETYTPEQKAEHEDKFCSHTDRFKYILVFEKEKVIGMTILCKRIIKFKKASVVLGGFGGVCVQKEKRRRGVASAMIKKGMEELKKANCDVAYLCTNISDSTMINLYQKFGFVALGKPHTYLGASGKRYTEKDAMLAPVNSPEIFQSILSDEEPFDIGRGNW